MTALTIIINTQKTGYRRLFQANQSGASFLINKYGPVQRMFCPVQHASQVSGGYSAEDFMDNKLEQMRERVPFRHSLQRFAIFMKAADPLR